jgi:hypothetical protein
MMFHGLHIPGGETQDSVQLMNYSGYNSWGYLVAALVYLWFRDKISGTTLAVLVSWSLTCSQTLYAGFSGFTKPFQG